MGNETPNKKGPAIQSDMPYQPLLDTIADRTEGRILRADVSMTALKNQKAPAGLSKAQKKRWLQFKHAARDVADGNRDQALFIEYNIDSKN